jgi:hypothetical protein
VLVDVRVAAADARSRVDHLHDHVDPLHGIAHQVVETHAQGRTRLVESGRVGEHDLHVAGRPDRPDVAPRRLRLVGDDRDLLADQRVHEGRLADVGASHDGHDAGAMARRPIVAHRASRSRSCGPKASGSSCSSDQERRTEPSGPKNSD